MNTFLIKRFPCLAHARLSILALALVALAAATPLRAASVQDIAPTVADAPVLLDIANLQFGNFAAFNGPVNSRLIASIGSADEVIYFGLSGETNNDGDPFNSSINSSYRFQVRRLSDGVVVHGPFTVDNNTANVTSYNEARFGQYTTTRVVGGENVYRFAPGQAGEYAIEFEDRGRGSELDRVLIPFWDFTVADATDNPIEGRVYSRSWAFRTPPINGNVPDICSWDREFNGRFYSYTDDGFVSLIDFTDAGFAGLSFTIAFNSTGPGNTGDLEADRRSLPGVNATEAAAEHRIFLSLPDETLFPAGTCGDINTADAFRCDGGEGSFCLEVSVSNPGQVEVILDFNGNGILDAGLDRTLVYEFTDNNLDACIPWDGLRDDGVPVGLADTISLVINYAQGVQHYAAYDLEFMRNGFCVETIRPSCDADGTIIESNILYWDDRLITEDPGTGAPIDNRLGTDCREVPRAWNYFEIDDSADCNDRDIDDFTEGYGDKNTLNTYWYANVNIVRRARIPIATVRVSGETAFCEGTTTTLTAETNGSDVITSVSWTGPGILGDATGESIVLNAAGEYCAAITSQSGCDDTICVNVILIDFQVNQFPDQASICDGETVQFPSADSTLNYSWSPTTGIDDPTSPHPVFNPSTTTTYTVTVTTNLGTNAECSVTEDVTINVSPEIGLEVQGGGPICEATATITATTDNPATVVLYAEDGSQVTGMSPFVVQVSGENNYYVIATDDNGCTERVDFSVTGGPVDISLPDTIISCLDEELILSVENLDPNDELSYSWTPSELFEDGTANTANPILTAGSGLYDITVEATNQFGCSTTENQTIVIIDEDASLSFTSLPDCNGFTVEFNNTSSVGFGYLWLFGDGSFSTEENPSHTYEAVGDYEVTLTLLYGQECVTDFTRTVQVQEGTLDVDFDADITDCDGVTGQVTFENQTNETTGAELTYMWTFTGATPLTSSEENPTVIVTESGTLTATLDVRSDIGCEGQAAREFTIELNEIVLLDEVTICPGESTELNPGGDGDNRDYTWSPSPDFDANDPNPVTSTPGVYSVTVTSSGADLNCESITTTTVILADSVNLVINGPDGPITGPDGSAGQVELPVIRTCGDPVDLSVDLNVGGDDLDVTYTDLDGNVLGNGSTISLNPDGSQTVVVTAVNPDGCSATDTIQIINSSTDAAIDAGIEGLMFCTATDTVVTVINNRAGDTLTYAWEDNDIISGPLNQESVRILSPASGSVELGVTVTNQFGCSERLTVTIQDIPFTPNEFPALVEPCYGESFTIAGGEVVDGYDYVFTPADGLDLSDPANPVGVFTEDGIISVTITDPETGCSSTQEIEVDVAPEISFMATPSDTSICEPGTVAVTGSSINDDVEINWYSDVGLTDLLGSGNTIDINADEIGQSYTIYGQAIDPSSGCSQMVPVTVTVSAITGGLPLPSLSACAGDDPLGIFDGTGADPDLVYTYEPADGLDLTDTLNPVFIGEENSEIVVTIVDPNTGCSTMSTVSATYTNLLELDGVADPSEIFLGEESVLSVNGCSGDSCEYFWMEPNGTISSTSGQTVTVEPDEVGTFTYEVDVEANGCMNTVTIELRVEDPICDETRVFIPNAFTPNGDNRNDVLRVESKFADLISDFRLIIYNRWGQEVYNSTNINQTWDGTAGGDELEPDVFGYWLRTVCPSGEELIQQGNITLIR